MTNSIPKKFSLSRLQNLFAKSQDIGGYLYPISFIFLLALFMLPPLFMDDQMAMVLYSMVVAPITICGTFLGAASYLFRPRHKALHALNRAFAALPLDIERHKEHLLALPDTHPKGLVVNGFHLFATREPSMGTPVVRLTLQAPGQIETVTLTVSGRSVVKLDEINYAHRPRYVPAQDGVPAAYKFNPDDVQHFLDTANAAFGALARGAAARGQQASPALARTAPMPALKELAKAAKKLKEHGAHPNDHALLARLQDLGRDLHDLLPTTNEALDDLEDNLLPRAMEVLSAWHRLSGPDHSACPPALKEALSDMADRMDATRQRLRTAYVDRLTASTKESLKLSLYADLEQQLHQNMKPLSIAALDDKDVLPTQTPTDAVLALAAAFPDRSERNETAPSAAAHAAQPSFVF